MTVPPPLGDDLALVRNMPLGFGNVSLSLRQMVQYHGSVWHTRPTPDSSSRSGALGKPAGAFAPRFNLRKNMVPCAWGRAVLMLVNFVAALIWVGVYAVYGLTRLAARSVWRMVRAVARPAC